MGSEPFDAQRLCLCDVHCICQLCRDRSLWQVSATFDTNRNADERNETRAMWKEPVMPTTSRRPSFTLGGTKPEPGSPQRSAPPAYVSTFNTMMPYSENGDLSTASISPVERKGKTNSVGKIDENDEDKQKNMYLYVVSHSDALTISL